MNTHKSNNSNEILNKLEAKLLNFTTTQREHINEIGKLNSSSFQGAEIATEFKQLKDLYVDLKICRNYQLLRTNNGRRFRLYYPFSGKQSYILIVSQRWIKLKNILQTKQWSQDYVKVWDKKKCLDYLKIFPLPFTKYPSYEAKARIIELHWKKI